MRIWASRQQWQAFLRRCKAVYPNEHCEAVWGEETVDRYASGRYYQWELAERFNVTQTNISFITLGRTWATL